MHIQKNVVYLLVEIHQNRNHLRGGDQILGKALIEEPSLVKDLLKKENFPTIPALMKSFMDVESIPTILHLIEEVPDFKSFIEEAILEKDELLVGHTKPQQVKFY